MALPSLQCHSDHYRFCPNALKQIPGRQWNTNRGQPDTRTTPNSPRTQPQEPHTVRTPIMPHAAAHAASLPIAVKTAVQIIHPKSAQLQHTPVIPDKPQPWTPV